MATSEPFLWNSLLQGLQCLIHWSHSDLQNNFFFKGLHSLLSDFLYPQRFSLTLFKALARRAKKVILEEDHLLRQGKGPFSYDHPSFLPQQEQCNLRKQLSRATTLPGPPIHHPSQQLAQGSSKWQGLRSEDTETCSSRTRVLPPNSQVLAGALQPAGMTLASSLAFLCWLH